MKKRGTRLVMGKGPWETKTEKSRDNRASLGPPISFLDCSLGFLCTQGGGGSFGKGQDLGPVELIPYLISCYLYIKGKPQLHKQVRPPSRSHPWGLFFAALCPLQPLGDVILVRSPLSTRHHENPRKSTLSSPLYRERH